MPAPGGSRGGYLANSKELAPFVLLRAEQTKPPSIEGPPRDPRGSTREQGLETSPSLVPPRAGAAAPPRGCEGWRGLPIGLPRSLPSRGCPPLGRGLACSPSIPASSLLSTASTPLLQLKESMALRRTSRGTSGGTPT